MIAALIFDLDGLLADTERLHCRAYQATLAEQGHDLSEAEYAEHWVRRGKGIDDWVRINGLEIDPQALRRRKSEHYANLLTTSLRPMDGAFEILESFHGKKKLALASSSYRDAVDGVLLGLGIDRYFDAVVSGMDVARVKPAPDIFLEAARQLGVDPARCLVLEDAEKGVVAAQQAGMHCIAVPNEFTRHHDFSKATRVCRSLTEASGEIFRALKSAGAGG